MSLSSRDAFKVEFLRRCASQGMTPEETLGAVKEARDKLAGFFDMIGKGVGNVVGAGQAVAENAGNWALPALAFGPAIAGGVGAMGLARATDIDDTDVDDIKDREIIDEYRRQVEHLNRLKSVRDHRGRRKPSGRLFM